ncbi:uncharacterized protein LOC132624120 [Lycium barbarum]|uniref:uncharacterized protein LOC132624120 n=1 Tax=Lycium barbarum TaxID=112863 RepID=UPI00293EF67F|nr:uncharacterized protein LOC132624120 [Lycium barbarum]
MYLWNRAAIAKHWWDIAHKQDKMWIRWIHSYYVKQQHMDSVPVPKQASWMVRKMFEARPLVANMQIQPTGKSMIGQIYHHALTARSKMPWKCIMYQNVARPKATFTMWLLLLDRLLTAERLSKWGIKVDTKCCFCQKYDETREHLFVQCEYARQVWTRVGQWMHIQNFPPTNWIQHQQWLIINSKGKSQNAQVFKMVSTEVTYAIWMERNSRLFEKQSRSWEAIAKEIVYVACVRANPRIFDVIHSFIF